MPNPQTGLNQSLPNLNNPHQQDVKNSEGVPYIESVKMNYDTVIGLLLRHK